MCTLISNKWKQSLAVHVYYSLSEYNIPLLFPPRNDLKYD